MMLFEKRNEHFLKISENIDRINNAKTHENENFKVHAETERENDNLLLRDKDLVCFYSNHSVYIAANGDVYPCCYTRMSKKYVIDNISNQDFRSFWRNHNNANHYKNLNVNLCPSCPYNDLNVKLKEVYLNGKDFLKITWE